MCACVCVVWDVDYGCLEFVFELMFVLVTGYLPFGKFFPLDIAPFHSLSPPPYGQTSSYMYAQRDGHSDLSLDNYPASIRQKFKCRVREDVARRREHAH